MSKLKQTTSEDSDNAVYQLVIEYWFRTAMNNLDISLSDIITIIVDYADTFEILTFSKEFMADRAFELQHNNTIASKVVHGNRWILTDIEPVKDGQVCWRINVKFTHKLVLLLSHDYFRSYHLLNRW